MLDSIQIKTDIRDGISFFTTEKDCVCPCCGKVINQEVMRMGGGRLDAGELDTDLHRNFIPTKEHGEAYPLIYLILVCDTCNFAGLKSDFSKLHKNTQSQITTKSAKQNRTLLLESLFTRVPNFHRKRDLLSGVAAHLLAISTYEYFAPEDSPTIKMAICTLRAAWICRHIREHVEQSEEIDLLINILYRKAFFLYDKAFELSINGKEDFKGIPWFGPDYDKDYGYDGIIYLHAWLYVNYDIHTDNGIAYKYGMLKKLRTNLSKVFGFGKTSRAKPSSLMGMARITYDQVQQALNKTEEEINAREK